MKMCFVLMGGAMDRFLEQQLAQWKEDPQRKPLVLDGARQVGKTWLSKEFGRRHFESVAYISLQDNERMSHLFTGDISPDRLVPALALEAGVPIKPQTTLIILDEVQEVPRALTALKYFCEVAPEYAVLATGSSLGIALHPDTSFPVGKVKLLRLYPMCFREFLLALGESQLEEVVSRADADMMALFHDKLLDYLKYYLVIGGMPEAVEAFASSYPNVDFDSIDAIQQQILTGYRDDFSKHQMAAPSGLPLRLNQVWDSIPSQLARENKKFFYGAVKKSARGRDFELAIQWLKDTCLVLEVPRVSAPQQPLAMFEDLGSFKLYLLDVGLLRAMAGLAPSVVLDGDELFATAKGAFAEQFACQELVATGYNPFYWAAKNATAELDFLLQQGSEVLPIEVKAGQNLRAKSLKASMRRFELDRGLRFSTLPPRSDGAVADWPLYAIGSRRVFERD